MGGRTASPIKALMFVRSSAEEAPRPLNGAAPIFPLACAGGWVYPGIGRTISMASRPASLLQPFVDRLLSHSGLTLEEREALFALPASVREIRGSMDLIRLGETSDRACIAATGMLAGFD